MSIVYKIFSRSDEMEIVGYDLSNDGNILLFTENQLNEIKSKPIEEQEEYAKSLVQQSLQK